MRWKIFFCFSKYSVTQTFFWLFLLNQNVQVVRKPKTSKFLSRPVPALANFVFLCCILNLETTCNSRSNINFLLNLFSLMVKLFLYFESKRFSCTVILFSVFFRQLRSFSVIYAWKVFFFLLVFRMQKAFQ